ncbi:10303_t:CDS:2, partial [Racocetra persica]
RSIEDVLDISLLESTNIPLINIELVTSETSIIVDLLTETELSDEKSIHISAGD